MGADHGDPSSERVIQQRLRSQSLTAHRIHIQRGSQAGEE